MKHVHRCSAGRAACRPAAEVSGGRLFHVYSHHPYTLGSSVFQAPDQPPNDPRTTVALYNLHTLLRISPKKPFYLTEYGYSTHDSAAFAGSSRRADRERHLHGPT